MDKDIPQNDDHKAAYEEDQVVESLQITQQILVILGEAWNRIDELENENAMLRQSKPGRPKTSAKPKGTPATGIVLVDDSKIMQVRLRNSIESLGFKVVGTAENGQLGAELVLKIDPKLVVLDHQMPDMTGVECLKAIRLQNTDVRVIVCTGGITEQVSQDYLKLDISSIITKPIQLDRFIASVRDAMSYDPESAQQDLENLVDNI